VNQIINSQTANYNQSNSRIDTKNYFAEEQNGMINIFIKAIEFFCLLEVNDMSYFGKKYSNHYIII